MVTLEVLIPIKSFAASKQRLSGILPLEQRIHLMKQMATAVVAATKDHPVWVVCDDISVADWAVSVGAGVAWHPSPDLNTAISNAVIKRKETADQVVVVHGDLPLARSLEEVVRTSANVHIITDRKGRGTKVLSVPTASDFRFFYGQGSANRHIAEARRLGASLHVSNSDTLSWDINTSEDLAELEQSHPKVFAGLGVRHSMETNSILMGSI